MKIGIDFDGVITDLGLLKSELEMYENEYLKSDLSITISKSNVDIEKLISFLSNFGTLYIVTARPAAQKKSISKWLTDNHFDNYIFDIICCGDLPKSEYLQKNNIQLLIDDKLENIDEKGYYYFGQSVEDIIIEVSKYLVSSNATFNKQKELSLSSITKIGNLGASPTFLIEYNNGTRHKLRICKDKKTFEQINSLLNFANENKLTFISKKVHSTNYCIFKQYTEGVSINTLSKNERIKYIKECAKCLSEFVLLCNSTNCNFSICSIDNFNTIITNERNVMFIDIESCFNGSFIIDLIWAERLLCKTKDEAKIFFDFFFNTIPKLNETEFFNEFKNYSTWLHCQLADSLIYHKNNFHNNTEILSILERHWENKEKLLLTLGFVQVGQTE